MNWEDSTSYRQGEHRGNVEPRAWTRKAGPLHVSVVRGHVYHPDTWVVHIRCADVTDREVGPDRLSADKAQRLALETFRQWLESVNAAAAQILSDK